MKAALERVLIPDAELARERARFVALAAFAQREPMPPRRRGPQMALGVAIAAAIGLAALSPPGRAVVDRVREVVGVERAQPALFSLPTSGRLLVASDPGVWVVEQDGSKRLLPGYREASWSPFGRFIVATGMNELAALEPDGDLLWTLARPEVRSPRWTGTATDTRIAYISAGSLHVVGGDGRGDAELDPDVQAVAPTWRPGEGFVVTYVDGRGAVVTRDVERRTVLWRRQYPSPVLQVEWSSDGRRLLVRLGDVVDILTRDGTGFTGVRADGSVVTASALRPRSHENTHALEAGGRTQVLHVGEPGGRLFAATGRFTDLDWSPDARWLVVTWPAADQWVFLRADGKRIRAVSSIAGQFRSRTTPRVEGWCCVP